MKIRIKRFDTNLPLPSYQTEGAACVDMYARLEVTIEPKTVGYIPLNVALEVPKGTWAMVAARSSTHKAGLLVINGIGVLDSDFRGDNDECTLAVYNFTDSPVTVARAQRIAQLMLMKHETFEFEEVEKLGNTDRGGFGSTGR